MNDYNTINSEDYIEVEGKIISVLPGTMFKVELLNNHVVLAHISGKLRKNFIKIAIGDIVKIKISKYDLNKGRIIYRLKNSSYRNSKNTVKNKSYIKKKHIKVKKNNKFIKSKKR